MELVMNRVYRFLPPNKKICLLLVFPFLISISTSTSIFARNPEMMNGNSYCGDPIGGGKSPEMHSGGGIIPDGGDVYPPGDDDDRDRPDISCQISQSSTIWKGLIVNVPVVSSIVPNISAGSTKEKATTRRGR